MRANMDHELPPSSTSKPPACLRSRPAGAGGSSRGGRQLKVSAMNSSARSKYYRQLRAKAVADLEAETRRLRDEVAWAELMLGLHHRLAPTIAPDVRAQILENLSAFVTKNIMTESFGLVGVRRSIEGLEVLHAGAPSPILRLRYSIHGRLHSRAVKTLYPFVVGNSLALGRMLHEDIELDCQLTVFFNDEGRIERVVIDRGELLALSRPLFGLTIAAQILEEVPSMRFRQQDSGQEETSTLPMCAPVAPGAKSEQHRECDEDTVREATVVPPRARTTRVTRGFPYVENDDCGGQTPWWQHGRVLSNSCEQ